jgi:hypothetical protein
MARADSSNILVVNSLDKHYTHSQGVVASVWTISHSLGKKPSVTVVDSGGNTIDGAIDYTDLNNLTITFNAGFTGQAFLN